MEQILKIVARNIDMLRSCNISRHGEKHWKMAKRSSDLFLGNSTLWRFQSGYFIVTRSFLLPSRQLDNWRPKNLDREIEVHDRWNRPFLCSFQNSLLRAKCGSRTKDVTRYRGDAAISGIMVIRATVAYRRLIRSVCNSSVPRGRWSSLIGFRDFEYVPRKNSLDIARDFSNFPRAIPLFPPIFSPPPLSALFSLSFEKSNLLPSVNYLRATMLEIVRLMRRFICFSLSLVPMTNFIGKYCWKVSRVNSALIFFENCATRMQSVFRSVYRRGSGSCFYKKSGGKRRIVLREFIIFTISSMSPNYAKQI